MKYIEIAKAVKAHGIKGEVKLQHFCDHAQDFKNFNTIYVKDGDDFVPIEILSVRADRNAVFIKTASVLSRNDAEAMRGTMFYVEKSDIMNMPENAYLIRDLIGIDVCDEDGNTLGVLKEILQHGSADVYVVKADKGFMFPALEHVIINTDIDKRKLTLDKKALSEVAVYED
jgi:16S rRNA processing protein RimM